MIEITDKAIDIAKLLSHVEDDGSGGLVLFVGRVRDHSQGEKVIALEYEAYESMALKQMQETIDRVAAKWPVNQIAMVHRVGYLKVGEVSVVIAVACAHRADAFAACRYAIDALKKDVPIWKKEYRPDGSHWVDGCQAESIETNTV